MFGLFGKKKEEPSTPAQPEQPQQPSGNDTHASIMKVKETIDRIDKRENFLQTKIEAEMANAQKFSKANKKKEALECLKRKKLIEAQINTINATKMTLMKQQMALESMNLNEEILAAQKDAANTMTKQVKRMGGVDAAEQVMDQIEDGLVDAEEINNAMSRDVGMGGVDADEDELMQELEGLETELLAKEMGNVNVGSGSSSGAKEASFPDAPEDIRMVMPSAPTKAVETEEEKILRELEASMSMPS